MTDKLKALVVQEAVQIQDRLAEMILGAPGSKFDEVFRAATEDDGLAILDRENVTLLITGLKLSQGTGFGLIRRLREQTKVGVGIAIVLTNHAVPALKVASFEAGADYFLDKSKDFTSVPRLITELCTERET